MSLVFVIVGTDFYALAGDGRVVNDGSIIQEDYKKVIEFGGNIGVGFAGTTKGAQDSVYYALERLVGQSVSFNDFFCSAHEGVRKCATMENHVLMAVTGVNNDEKFIIKTIDSRDINNIGEYIPDGLNPVRFVSLYNSNTNIDPNKIFMDFVNSDKPRKPYDYLELATKTILEVSKKDDTVNDRISAIIRVRQQQNS